MFDASITKPLPGCLDYDQRPSGFVRIGVPQSSEQKRTLSRAGCQVSVARLGPRRRTGGGRQPDARRRVGIRRDWTSDDPARRPRKSTRIKRWPDKATTVPAVIAGWFEEWPEANLGIVGGSGLVILDVDPRHGGGESWADLI